MRLAVATCRDFPQFHPDDAELIHQLPPLGITPTPSVWNDPHVPWNSFDAVLIRTVWDYYRHYGEFVAWLHRLESLGMRVVNPLRVLLWNADKRYLLDLERADVPVVPGRISAHADLAAQIRRSGLDEVVVKPTVSAGAWHTLRLRADASDLESALAALPENREYLIQPYVPEVAGVGEWSLMFFDGSFSHAVRKRPAAGEFRVQEKLGGTVEAAEPPPAATAVAQKALAALPDLGVRGVLYARVDLVETGAGVRLMELELIEPQLYLRFGPDAARRFARALAKRLRSPSDSSSDIGL
jgi:glutathione synthase/RimK-type ligase-like ATP-grasp enzyme